VTVKAFPPKLKKIENRYQMLPTDIVLTKRTNRAAFPNRNLTGNPINTDIQKVADGKSKRK